MENAEQISVAEMRKDLGDVLSRAHYQDEIIMVAKRDKPFAIVASFKAGQRLGDLDKIARQLDMDGDDFMGRLKAALTDEQRKSLLLDACSP